jgi:hypothetical protein
MMNGKNLKRKRRITRVLRLETCRLKEKVLLVKEKRRRSRKWKKMKQVNLCQNAKCSQVLGR